MTPNLSLDDYKRIFSENLLRLMRQHNKSIADVSAGFCPAFPNMQVKMQVKSRPVWAAG